MINEIDLCKNLASNLDREARNSTVCGMKNNEPEHIEGAKP